MDDILVYSTSHDEHVEHLRLASSLLRESQMYAKLSERSSLRHEIESLGHMISAKGF